METIYLCIVIFLFVLAVFDLMVGVSNDAVNFLNSAIGAKAASFKTVLFIAGIGIFIGASLSNGMMDIARHGIYQPEHFYFAEIMCILLAVMLTDVVLLDVFNSMGMPTSTTVSMVFELLGGTFALALIKVHNNDMLGLGDLMSFADSMAPLGNASAEDCADYVLTLFSDLTRKVTMQNLYHDGGFSSMGMSRRAMKTYENGMRFDDVHQNQYPFGKPEEK